MSSESPPPQRPSSSTNEINDQYNNKNQDIDEQLPGQVADNNEIDQKQQNNIEDTPQKSETYNKNTHPNEDAVETPGRDGDGNENEDNNENSFKEIPKVNRNDDQGEQKQNQQHNNNELIQQHHHQPSNRNNHDSSNNNDDDQQQQHHHQQHHHQQQQSAVDPKALSALDLDQLADSRIPIPFTCSPEDKPPQVPVGLSPDPWSFGDNIVINFTTWNMAGIDKIPETEKTIVNPKKPNESIKVRDPIGNIYDIVTPTGHFVVYATQENGPYVGTNSAHENWEKLLLKGLNRRAKQENRRQQHQQALHEAEMLKQQQEQSNNLSSGSNMNNNSLDNIGGGSSSTNLPPPLMNTLENRLQRKDTLVGGNGSFNQGNAMASSTSPNNTLTNSTNNKNNEIVSLPHIVLIDDPANDDSTANNNSLIKRNQKTLPPNTSDSKSDASLNKIPSAMSGTGSDAGVDVVNREHSSGDGLITSFDGEKRTNSSGNIVAVQRTNSSAAALPPPKSPTDEYFATSANPNAANVGLIALAAEDELMMAASNNNNKSNDFGGNNTLAFGSQTGEAIGMMSGSTTNNNNQQQQHPLNKNKRSSLHQSVGGGSSFKVNQTPRSSSVSTHPMSPAETPNSTGAAAAASGTPRNNSNNNDHQNQFQIPISSEEDDDEEGDDNHHHHSDFFYYSKVESISLWACHIVVFARNDLKPHIRRVNFSVVKTGGLGGAMGNKGGLCVEFSVDFPRPSAKELANDPNLAMARIGGHQHDTTSGSQQQPERQKSRRTREDPTQTNIRKTARDKPVRGINFAFVCCHLAPHQNAVKDRNENIKTILEKLQVGSGGRFSKEARRPPGGVTNRLASDEFDFFMLGGDLNYRIDGHKEAIEKIIHHHGNLRAVLSNNDQLLKQLRTSKDLASTFRGFREGPLTFRPTYKYETKKDIEKKKTKAKEQQQQEKNKNNNNKEENDADEGVKSPLSLEMSGYDRGPKNRLPSYTDRVLYRRHFGYRYPMHLLHYYDLRDIDLSDHKPVVALVALGTPFEAEIKKHVHQAKLAGVYFEDEEDDGCACCG